MSKEKFFDRGRNPRIRVCGWKLGAVLTVPLVLFSAQTSSAQAQDVHARVGYDQVGSVSFGELLERVLTRTKAYEMARSTATFAWLAIPDGQGTLEIAADIPLRPVTVGHKGKTPILLVKGGYDAFPGRKGMVLEGVKFNRYANTVLKIYDEKRNLSYKLTFGKRYKKEAEKQPPLTNLQFYALNTSFHNLLFSTADLISRGHYSKFYDKEGKLKTVNSPHVRLYIKSLRIKDEDKGKEQLATLTVFIFDQIKHKDVTKVLSGIKDTKESGVFAKLFCDTYSQKDNTVERVSFAISYPRALKVYDVPNGKVSKRLAKMAKFTFTISGDGPAQELEATIKDLKRACYF